MNRCVAPPLFVTNIPKQHQSCVAASPLNGVGTTYL